MNIQIINPNEDQYGNAMENIFLAFDEREEFLGNAFVYPSINMHQTGDTPYLLFIQVNTDQEDVRQPLFDQVYNRAKALRALQPDLKARIYTGFEPDEEKLAFYVKNGFDPQYTVIMEKELEAMQTIRLSKKLNVEEIDTEDEDVLASYKSMYDDLFVTPLDLDDYEAQSEKEHFRNFVFSIDGEVVGGCTIFEDEGYGHVETLYVMPSYRGQGMGKQIMQFIFNYFKSVGLSKSKLEVWELNQAAVKLYQGLDYKIVNTHLMFPGVDG
ncbi:GNAT family N-acetyltransferase [Exiguobacterium algae]|uniref:GNAT family N-acetyltransferase n=1 Tax=Exiguobacterium algae TaxID=2751250 RepID=UPI001BEB8247|nr:GNAT family N-acetyltransferase [Exiguobacterium algae]